MAETSLLYQGEYIYILFLLPPPTACTSISLYLHLFALPSQACTCQTSLRTYSLIQLELSGLVFILQKHNRWERGSKRGGSDLLKRRFSGFFILFFSIVNYFLSFTLKLTLSFDFSTLIYFNSDSLTVVASVGKKKRSSRNKYPEWNRKVRTYEHT